LYVNKTYSKLQTAHPATPRKVTSTSPSNGLTVKNVHTIFSVVIYPSVFIPSCRRRSTSASTCGSWLR